MTSLDELLPVFDAREHHGILVEASPQEAYDAFRRVDLSRSRLLRLIFGIRTLPAFFRRQPWGIPKGIFIDQVLSLGWVVLKEAPGQELVAGAVTQPWAAVVEFTGLPPADFVAFAEPGFVKIIWGFSAAPEGPGLTRLTTETRVLATDAAARAKFRRYWFFFSPGIRIIRRVALKLVRRDLAGRRDVAGR
jgi:hypothetical protein